MDNKDIHPKLKEGEKLSMKVVPFRSEKRISLLPTRWQFELQKKIPSNKQL
jgi:hypothetical protein